MEKLANTEFTLKDIICTPGFSEAFKRMARYTERTGKEALIDAKIPVYPMMTDIVYDMMYGNEEAISGNARDNTAYRITNDGWLNKDITSGLGVFQLHTHPDAPKEQPNRYLRFSEPDIEGHINSSTWYNPRGVVVQTKPDHARCLIWQPDKRVNTIANYVDELAEELDRLAMLETPKEVVSHLRKYGQADLIDFVKKDKIWQPKQASVFEKYVIKHDVID